MTRSVLLELAEVAPALATPSFGDLRPFLGVFLASAVVWWTADRALGEGNEPSLSFFGDDVLFRASRLPLVAGTALLAAVLLAPRARSTAQGTVGAAALVGIVGIWFAWEWREQR